MKLNKTILLFIGFSFISLLNINAQELTQKQLEYEKNKVQIFTVNERDNLLNWFSDRAKLMNLTEAKEDEYINILIFYFVKMGRLDDKDKGNSKEEIIQKLDVLIKKQDAEIKEILTEEEYKMHLKNYGEFMQNIKKRIAETDY